MVMSFKYKFLLKMFKVLKMQKIMALPPEKSQKLFRKAYKGVVIPNMSDAELDIETAQVADSTVVWYKHKKENRRLCFYLVGGGMLKYPKPRQAKGLIKLAKQCNIDFVLPYYPLVLTGHTLPDTYEMLYELYKKALEKYKPKNIYFLGGSSGGNLALGLISHINAKGEKLPMPGKIYASSPGTLLLTEEERRKAEVLDKTDVIMSQKGTLAVWEGMTGGREVPDYMKYLQLGDYTGLRDVYLSFGGDEVFTAAAESIKAALEKYDVKVTLEIGAGMYYDNNCNFNVTDDSGYIDCNFSRSRKSSR
ncbi:MAG TPA: alpha/beta hydrolase [Candidatus Acetatifactor stercoripullorum]|uniref:Alpha/beta hydrolase n=1 Tax=Candidatus Acetatifactor stercoripullorum TaxID=2838414 RepID=A0A9D1UBX4_9FIRM|nr:alpha/beta hydrolase [Candidatus Acetatifactor stercoripullorum]